MSGILYNIIIAPIELVVEIIFELMFRIVGQHETNQGLAVIGVSIAISLLTLPLYKRADAVQQKERDLQKRLSKWTTHIRKTFKGDERFMMQQTYYRENGYSPMMALNGSISLLLEIPFFIAAYHFLSHLQALEGAAFGPISNLGKPDSLITLGSFSINLLPVLMTAINCISSAVYLKGFPIKDKIQTYGMALIFLVLLYNSPSGLVVYWTCNNIFSLVKNIFYKIKNPKKVAVILCAVLGSLFSAALLASGILNSKKKIIATVGLWIITFIPLILFIISSKGKSIIKERTFEKQNSKGNVEFILCGLFLTILLGLLIPSAVIASSPAEFVDLQNYRNPLLYLVNSTCYAAGFFILWAGIIRYMMNERFRPVMNLIFWIISGIFLINYMCFGHNLGILSPTLVYENELVFSKAEKLVNLLAVILTAAVLFFLFRLKKLVPMVTLILAISTAAISISQIHKAQSLLNDMSYIKDSKDSTTSLNQVFTLSRTGKNVIVFMLDRAISGYVPYIFEEKPEIRKQFEGFTYYPNTLSHGFYTNFGSPALFGGYEYTVTEMNKRSSELLSEKHNEALKVMPKLFSENNFKVTICDPPYANYKWVPDLSIFDDFKEVKATLLSGYVVNNSIMYNSSETIILNNRNFFLYGIFKVLPLSISPLIYNEGDYFTSKNFKKTNDTFLKEYSVLTLLANITDITEEKINTFLSISNCTTHQPCILQLPEYEPKETVNNSGFKIAAEDYIELKNEDQISHYYVNVAAFIQLAKWFDYLRQNNVWDNTRIIIVADHGKGLSQFDYMLMKNPEIDVESCNPLLMVKDFNSKDFITSNEFMTNADVPALAVRDLIESPVNPYTGKIISSEEKLLHPQLVTSSNKWDTNENNGTVFDTSDGHWYSVHDDIFKEENWELIQ